MLFSEQGWREEETGGGSQQAEERATGRARATRIEVCNPRLGGSGTNILIRSSQQST